MNLSQGQWDKIKKLSKGELSIDITPTEFIVLMGFDGGMFFSGKANDKESIFIEELYRIGRKLKTGAMCNNCDKGRIVNDECLWSNGEQCMLEILSEDEIRAIKRKWDNKDIPAPIPPKDRIEKPH